MPIYEYRCTNGHTFEVFQSMSEDPLTKCVECQASAERVLSPPAVHFKGTGFYTTDYGSKSKKAPAETGAKSESSSSSSSSDSSSSSSSSD
ncbi:MAG TPA: FmdB family zinc ribbon protein [Solirubrobacterales bacterium]|jgi:putative FmdB family regulatory protein